MFCPSCGEAGQTEKSYCRRCGGFLQPLGEPRPFIFGGFTPEKQLGASLYISLAVGVLSFFLSIWIFVPFANVPESYPVVYLAGVFLNLFGFLELINVILLLKLKARFNGKKGGRSLKPRETVDVASSDEIQSAGRSELPEADCSGIIPVSVVEDTTKQLSKNHLA